MGCLLFLGVLLGVAATGSFVAACLAQENLATVDVMESQIRELEAAKAKLETELATTNDRLLKLRKELALEKAKSLKPMDTVISSSGYGFYSEPTLFASKMIRRSTPGEPVSVLDFDKDKGFYRVRMGEDLGYVMRMDVVETPDIITLRESKGLILPPEPDQKPVSSTGSSGTPAYGGTSTGSSGKTIYTGPRGGRYHYSASGKKVYEKKKK